MTLEELKNIILEKLKDNKDIYKIILFGSYARGDQREDSDIDLMVILNKDDFPKSFKEKIDNTLSVSSSLLELNYEYAMDIKVYTRAEYKYVTNLESSFIKSVLAEGINLI
jgi:uncharacterized protein